jgi:3-hydroxy acid dehydrogenase / malonic semialdehyde reductase
MDHVVSSIYKPVSLRGKTALVTGASAGIGKACAILLAEQGATVILVARRLTKLESVRQEIESLIPTADIHIEQCDISDVSSIKELAERLKSRQVDILVNNAGLALGTETGDKVSVDDIKTMFGTNIIGLMAMVSAFSPQMRARNSGEIVNIGSVAGSDHYAGGAIYCATKAAVEAYSNSLRMDLIDTNIRVIAINPGMVSGTEFSLVRFKGDSELASVPYKGLNCLTALDIADQVVYAVTRPLNVQIAQLKSYCNQQGHAKYAISRD